MQGDVYPVEPFDDSSKNQILDAHWGVLYDEDVRNLHNCYCLSVYFLPLMFQFRR